MKLLLPFVLFIFALPCLANVEIDGDLSVATNDNIPNAVSKTDIFDDSFLAGNLNVAKLWVPATGKSILLSGHLGLVQFNNSGGLNRHSAGSSLSYIQRMGMGAYAPRFSVSVRADYRDFDSDLRDGWLYRAGINLEKRFTPALHARVGLAHEERSADKQKATPYVYSISGDVFNQSNNEFSASIDYTLINNSMISARYTYRDGEIDASTNPGSAFFPFSKAIAQDHQLCDSCQNYVVYLVDATSHGFVIDWNWPLGNDSSVSTSIERRIADTDGNNTYTANILQIKLNQRF
ncbi:hypothetical protein N9E57_01785 [Gammaproteobacteria bacterium]|nr:hypothetical protein [Gammaproteobacteria bacterium]